MIPDTHLTGAEHQQLLTGVDTHSKTKAKEKATRNAETGA